MLKLYRVDVEFSGATTLMVLAEGEQEAEYIGIEAAEDEDAAYSADACVALKLEDIPRGWANDVPWGIDDGDGRTCREWLTDGLLQQAKPIPDPRQLQLGETAAAPYTVGQTHKILRYSRLLEKIGHDTAQATDDQLEQLLSLLREPVIQQCLDTAEQVPTLDKEPTT